MGGRRTTRLTSRLLHEHFPHAATLRDGTNVGFWQNWCTRHFGPTCNVIEAVREQRWAYLGGLMVFKRGGDLRAFVDAARDDLEGWSDR